MEKTIFTPEFYQKVYDCIMDVIDDMDDGANYFECVIGDVTVSASVMVDVTEEDRSFSHAFGIQREPDGDPAIRRSDGGLRGAGRKQDRNGRENGLFHRNLYLFAARGPAKGPGPVLTH